MKYNSVIADDLATKDIDNYLNTLEEERRSVIETEFDP